MTGHKEMYMTLVDDVCNPVEALKAVLQKAEDINIESEADQTEIVY